MWEIARATSNRCRAGCSGTFTGAELGHQDSRLDSDTQISVKEDTRQVCSFRGLAKLEALRHSGL